MATITQASRRRRAPHTVLDPRSRAIGRAWERFVSAGEDDPAALPVRNVVARSWQRCRSGGVDPTRMVAPRLIDDAGLLLVHESNRLLLECASMAIDQGKRFLEETDAILLVTNAEGLTLEVVGDPATIYDAQQIGLVPGAGWPEVLSGSNAVGTAIENKGAVQIHGQEHYCEGFKPWTCTATVIRDPYDGQCVGVLDISGLIDSYHRCHMPLVVSWSSLIEARLAHKIAETEARLKALPRRYVSDSQLLFDRAGHLLGADDAVLQRLVRPGTTLADLRRCRLLFSEDAGVTLMRDGRPLGTIDAEQVEPIRQRSEILGFRLVLPPESAAPRKAASRPPEPATPFCRIIGESPAIRETVARATHVAPAPLPVLLLGETGVGKEVFARAIHEAGPNAKGPFIDLNCGALSRDMLASELFGYVEGAFTGARRGGMVGKVEAAAGGTLFLDEIGEMPLDLQPMFLRVLQERRFYRMGDVTPRSASFRLIAATNRDLSEEVNTGRFRKDLWFRIATMPIIIPPLRERAGDVGLLARHVLDRCVREHGVTARELSPALVRRLEQRQWPGNVRELANVIEAMCFLSRREMLTPDDLPPDTLTETPRPGAVDSLDQAEAGAIARAVEACRGNLTEVARRLGISKSTLYQKLRKYGIERPAPAGM